MAIHPVATAFPSGGTSYDAIQQNLADAFPLVLTSANEIQSINFSQALAVVVPQEVRLNGTAFLYDAADSTTAHDGVSCLVSQDNKRYKSSVQPSYFTNVLDRTNTPPGSPAIGDRYLTGTAPTGAWASQANKFTVYISTGWVFVAPVIGQRTYVRDEAIDYQYGEAGTWAAAGAVDASSVGAAELEFPWGMAVESETVTPPSTRHTTATPTMPLGGTAANINDDTIATEATTSALGNLTAATADGRVFAKLDLGADVALAGIQVKGVKCSSGSSSASAMKLAYATAAAPTTWVELGAGFTLSTADQDVARSGTFTARYLAVITEAKDWSTATHTLDDLNAYKQVTSAAAGTKWIVAANGIAIFSGQDTKVAEATLGGVLVFYTPYDAAEVADRNRGIKVRFNALTGEWESVSGAVVARQKLFTQSLNSEEVAGDGASYSDTVPLSTASAHVRDGASITHTAKRVDAELEFYYEFRHTDNRNWVIGLFRDTETDAIDWKPKTGNGFDQVAARFFVTANDGNEHVYKIRLHIHGVSTIPTIGNRRTFEMKEYE